MNNYTSVATSNNFVAPTYAPQGKYQYRNECLNIVSLHEEDDDHACSMIKDKREGKTQRADTCWSPKRHIPDVSWV